MTVILYKVIPHSMIKRVEYRLRTQQLYLTWPKLGKGLEDILNDLKEVFNKGTMEISRYLICNELHMDGSPHRHAYIKLNQPVDIRDCKFADITWNGDIYHGNYQGCRSPKNVIGYCKKKDDYICNFDINEVANNKRLRMKEICKELVSGNLNLYDVVKEDEEMIKGYRNFKQDLMEFKLDSYVIKMRTINAQWWYGNTRLGKSYGILKAAGINKNDPASMKSYYPKSSSNKWWDGYNGQLIVLMDEIEPGRKGEWMIEYMKRWTDSMPCLCETKRGTVHAQWTTFLVTSQHSIDGIFGLEKHDPLFEQREKDIAAIKARFNIKHITMKLY